MAIPFASLAPQIYKGAAGAAQAYEASKLKKRDNTPPAFREALALGRQAATAALPGQGTALNRLSAGSADVLAAGARAGTSSNSIIGLLEKSDAARQQGLANLATREDAYHDQKSRELVGLLGKQAAYQSNDQDAYDKGKARLTQASQQNAYGAIDGASQIYTYYQDKKDREKNKSKLPITSDIAASGAANALDLSVTGPDDIDPLTKRRLRYNQYGIFDPTGSIN